MSENEYLQLLIMATNAKIDTLIQCVSAMHRHSLMATSEDPEKMERFVKNFYDGMVNDLNVVIKKIYKDFGVDEIK